MLFGKILYHSKIGYLTILSDDHYIRKIKFGKQELPKDAVWAENHPLLQQVEQQLLEYFAGERRSFTLPLQADSTDFQKSVWNALQQIPYGTVRTYGELAKQLERPKAARAIGRACHNNPIAIVIPCHRVVGANGNLTGFAGGLSIKQILLELEQRN